VFIPGQYLWHNSGFDSITGGLIALARQAKITALGTYLPPRILTNADLEKMVNTSDEWILERTGISTRYLVTPGMATSDMAIEAARAALASRGLAAQELDMILVASVTPDMLFPATACLVQRALGSPHAWGFDLLGACCGFLYALTVAAQFVVAGSHKCVLVIGADTMSSIVDYTDRATCILFGDAAGAVLVEPAEEDGEGIIDFYHEVDGAGADVLYMPAGGSRRPASEETVRQKMHYVHQEGQQVFKFAVRKQYDVCKALLDRHGLRGEDVQVMIAHQANRRIITATSDRLGIPRERVIINVDRYGNTTAATIPLAMRTALEEGKLKKGDLVLLCAVGAGFTAGAALVRWSF